MSVLTQEPARLSCTKAEKVTDDGPGRPGTLTSGWQVTEDFPGLTYPVVWPINDRAGPAESLGARDRLFVGI